MIRTSLGASHRRTLLDAELARCAGSFRGVVLDVGGRRQPRGRFRPPRGAVRRWVLLNIDPRAEPDILGDAEALPIREASVDRILCQEVIQYVDRYETMLAEFSRVLVPDGQLVLSAPLLHRVDHIADRQRFSGGRLVELLERAGLRVDQVTQQGYFFGTLAHMLRQAGAQVASRPLRALLALPVLAVGFCLGRLDHRAATARSAFLSSYTTGYVVIARKR
ncbi:MAG: methyltransferase domain-containing protein [Candidatus Rokubacteria bacterium]|nr:methyltransferase domain-containing protein [Candidatus Rokubacteria bacterium]MBI3105855.1 methyltransferase domain-containing protein [Candidatus Rokubacteria bacterium]